MTLSQTKLFVLFLLAGFVITNINIIINYLLLLFKNNYVVRFVCDMLFTIWCGLTMLYLFNMYNFGILRLYLVFAFLLGATIQHYTLGKLFAMLTKKLYNASNKWWKSVRKSKIFTPLFK